MRSGDLRYRITIQQNQPIKDNEAITVDNWTEFATVWGAVEPIRGREYFQAAAVNAENTVRFRIRYQKGITSKMRVSYDERTFNIQTVIDIDEQHREIHLMCLEVVAGG